MQLYCGMTKEFVDDATLNRVGQLLESSWSEYFGYPPSASELRSWQNSLRALALQIHYSRLLDHGIILEMRLPLTSARLDCLLAGHDERGQQRSVIIELKQWESVESSEIDECVITFIGGAKRATTHPAIQASHYEEYLSNTMSAFSKGEGAIALSSCCYLHNLTYDPLSPIYNDRFASVLSKTPAFSQSQGQELSEFLRSRLSAGNGEPVLAKIVSSKYQPSKKLLAHVAEIIQGNAAYTLLDDQIVVYNTICTYARKALRSKKRTVLLINGGPGTGKSLIALNVMADLSRSGINAQYATGSRAFTGNLRKAVGSKAGIQFRYFNSYTEVDPEMIDVLIMDEAHRIRESSNSRFTRKQKRSDRSQIMELIEASKVSVFFIDDLQVVRPGEVGSSELVAETAAMAGAHLIREELKTQFRCAGSDQFVEWVDDILEIGGRESCGRTYDRSSDFDFRIVDSPAELERLIRERNRAGIARMVAGFCWPWSNARADGTLIDDVTIGDWERPWNAKPEAARLAKGVPKAQFWASDPGGVDQVGCIYTAQGFEFDFVGVIFGRDLIWDPTAKKWRGQKAYSHDTVVKRAGEKFVDYAKNVYRVLLTRGLKGCYLLFLDDWTREHFESRVH
jgi:DUF2075 family protein